MGAGGALPARTTSRCAGGEAAGGVADAMGRGPQDAASVWGRDRSAGTHLLLGGRVGGAWRRCEVDPAPSPRGSARRGGGERAGWRRRLAGGRPPLGPPRPGRSGSDAASGGLGVGEPAEALGGPDGAQAESLGKGGGWAGPAGPRPVLRSAHVQPVCSRAPRVPRTSSFLLRTLYFLPESLSL